MTELEFVQYLGRRSSHTWDCHGPLARVRLAPAQIDTLEAAWANTASAEALLWSNIDPACEALEFNLCAVHWFDLACLAGVHGRLFNRADWRFCAALLLYRVCRHIGWDPREISNLLAWQRVRLT